MFLIKLKTIGNCIVPDLDDFMIYSGNNDIMDLDEFFSPEQIKKSMRYPEGDLKQLLDQNIISIVQPESIEYKKQLREKAKQQLTEQSKTNKKPIKETITELKKMETADCLELIDNKYFDNLSILDKIINDEEFPEKIKKFAKDLMSENLNQRIDQKFILI